MRHLAVIVFTVLLTQALAFAEDKPQSTTGVSSKPVTQDGLQVTVTLAKPAFAADEQPKFTVQYKNVSDKALNLCDPGWFWAWSIRCENTTGIGAWVLDMQMQGKLQLSQHTRVQPTQTIEPGKTLEVVIDLANSGLPLQWEWDGPQKGLPAPQAHLPPHEYKLAVEIKLDSGSKAGVDYWTGKIDIDPLPFKIAAPGTTTQP